MWSADESHCFCTCDMGMHHDRSLKWRKVVKEEREKDGGMKNERKKGRGMEGGMGRVREKNKKPELN